MTNFLFRIKLTQLQKLSTLYHSYVMHPTCRCAPLVHVWCMRYESKHAYFKQLACVVGKHPKNTGHTTPAMYVSSTAGTFVILEANRQH